MPKTRHETYGPDLSYHRPAIERLDDAYPPGRLAQMAERLVIHHAGDFEYRQPITDHYFDFHFTYTPQHGPPPFTVKVSMR